MVLISGFCIAGSFHKFLHFHIHCPDRVYHDMDMDVPSGIMTVGVCTDESLMPRKVFLGKSQCEGLGGFKRETVFVPVPRGEADGEII